MASRSRSRQFALQMLYSQTINPTSPDKLFPHFWERHKGDSLTQKYAEDLVRGVLDHGEDLDLEISGYLVNWSLDRIAKMDLLILRTALYELLHETEIPWKVVINEALSLVKMFSDKQSVSFVNGVLHRWCEKNKARESANTRAGEAANENNPKAEME